MIIWEREGVGGQTIDTLEVSEEVLNDGGLEKLGDELKALKSDGSRKSLEGTVDQVTSNRGVIEGSMADYMLKISNSQPPNPPRFSRGLWVVGESTTQDEWFSLGLFLLRIVVRILFQYSILPNMETAASKASSVRPRRLRDPVAWQW